MAFNEKKFLDKAGVSHLWGKIVAKIADDVTVEKNRAELAESGLSERIAKFEGDGAGSVAAAKAAADAAQADVDALENKVGTVAEGSTVVGMIGAVQGEVDALENKVGAVAENKTVVGMIEAVQGEVDAVEEDLGNVDGLSTTNKTVVGAINEVLAAVGAGGTAATISITTDTTTDGALKSYTVKQGTTTIGVIDIPKDMVVEAGEVVVDPEGQEAGTYIKLKLANVTAPLYINVGKLVDIYTVKADAPQVQLAIDPSTREISATIVAGSVTATELAANAVTTEKIANANVTKEKLSTAVQASLDKADASATQTDLTSAVGRIDALEGKFGEGAGTVESQIATAKQAAIDAAAADATSKANAAQAAAEATASADATAKANKALEDAKADATSKANTAESNAKAYADSLADNYDTKGEAQAAYNAIVALTNAEIDAACVIAQA